MADAHAQSSAKLEKCCVESAKKDQTAGGLLRPKPSCRTRTASSAYLASTTTEILIHTKEFLRLKKDLNAILIKHTGQDLAKIEKDTDRDRFLSAQEAVEYGLVDNVLERMQLSQVQPKPVSS